MRFFQCRKMRSARKRHMPGGYAAVGEVLNPPPSACPIIACLCLCPQKLGNGPEYQPPASKEGHPLWPNSTMPSMSVKSLVGFGLSTPNWHWWPATVQNLELPSGSEVRQLPDRGRLAPVGHAEVLRVLEERRDLVSA